MITETHIWENDVLLYAPGDEVPEAEAERLGLVAETKAAKAPAKDKAAKPAADK